MGVSKKKIFIAESFGETISFAECLGWTDTYADGDDWTPEMADACEAEAIEYIEAKGFDVLYPGEGGLKMSIAYSVEAVGLSEKSLGETELFDTEDEAICAGGELWSDYADRIRRGRAELLLWKHDISPTSGVSHCVCVRSLSVSDFETLNGYYPRTDSYYPKNFE